MSMVVDIATGADMLSLARSNGHRRRGRTCPACKADLARVAIVDLVYTYERCDCSEASYTHLIEQLWHRDEFLPDPTEPDR